MVQGISKWERTIKRAELCFFPLSSGFNTYIVLTPIFGKSVFHNFFMQISFHAKAWDYLLCCTLHSHETWCTLWINNETYWATYSCASGFLEPAFHYFSYISTPTTVQLCNPGQVSFPFWPLPHWILDRLQLLDDRVSRTPHFVSHYLFVQCLIHVALINAVLSL